MLETPEACARLRRKLEQWPDAKRSPITINQGLELLDMVDRLEKESDWMAKRIYDLYHADYAPECLVGREMPVDFWREAARRAVEEQCKSN